MYTATLKSLLKKISACLFAASLLMPLMATEALAGKPGGGGGGGGGSGGGSASAGKTLYDGICFACHGYDGGGRFSRKNIRNKSATSIKGAVAHKVYAMSFLTYLTDTDYKNLEAYIKTVSGAGSQLLRGSGNSGKGEPLFRRACTGCHSINNGTNPGIGPDLKSVPTDAPTWIQAFIAEPKAMATHAYTADLLGMYPYVMPNLGLGDYSALDLQAFISQQQVAGPLLPNAPVSLTAAEFDATKHVYFDHCAGCHGLYRMGATGPNIEPARAQQIGTDGLGAMVRYGTPAGMPAWGLTGTLSEDNITKLSSYLQMTPPTPPPLEMPQIIESWNLIVPVANRPATPQRADWENNFGVILRDASKVAIYDGSTKQEIVRLDVGFAAHILRSSSSGRYFYVIGRDGLVSMIDMWASTPNIVASVKGCHDARSVESSKFGGYEDRYLIEGCYWPPQYVVYDGLTLEPLARNDLPMQSITGETLPEVRVASIVGSSYEPLWVISLKESGYVGLVDYSQPGFPLVATIPAEKFLHDGGWDHTGRYFLVAANASNKMVVIDTATRSLVTSFTTGNKPHPGRGSNWQDPVYGWVNATAHLGEAKVSIYGADPAGRPDVAWKVVREITLPGSGSLFHKTHPNSPWVLFDMALSTDATKKQICAYSKATGALDRCFTVATNGQATHFEFNKDGTEVWVSDWAADGSLIVLNAQTLAEITRITGVTTPTGKFNVYNTTHDIY